MAADGQVTAPERDAVVRPEPDAALAPPDDEEAEGVAACPVWADCPRYRSLAEIEAAEAALEALPNVTRHEFGRSVEGRVLTALRVTLDAERVEPRPALFVDGTHHACERPVAEAVLEVATYFADALQTDPAMRDTLSRVEIWFIPVLNVDGFHYADTVDP